MRFHRAIRRAVFARLLDPAPPPMPAPVFSSPPTNARPPYSLIGAITSEEPLAKDGDDAFYRVAVENWIQSGSPEQLDAMSDAVAVRLRDAALTDVDAAFWSPVLIAEADTWNPDAVGGPTFGRIQTFQIFAQHP